MDTRDFKGIWIPKEIWLDDRLNAIEKIVLAEIDSLDGENGCWASNEYLAEFCKCSTCKISTTISKLKDLGYLEIQSFNGRNRVLKSRLAETIRQTYKNYKADFENLKPINITNNKDINIDNNKKNKEKDYKAEFEELWKLYPNKKGKENALKAYIKARKEGTEEITVRQGIENYVADIKKKGTDKKYILYGSTYFNGHRWEDEFTEPVKRETQSYNSEIYKQKAQKPIEYKRK